MDPQSKKAPSSADDLTLEKLTRELTELKAELASAYLTQETLGGLLKKSWRSWQWFLGRPFWMLQRAAGRLDRGAEHLIPLADLQRGGDGAWRSTVPSRFVIPTVPLHGWVRVRARINSSVESRATLCFDTGHGFDRQYPFQLAPVSGSTEIERMLYLKTPTYLIAFDPVEAAGQFSVESFSLQPVSSLWFHIEAILRNIRMRITGIGSHRPSLLLGITLLLRGEWAKFHRQLIANFENIIRGSQYDVWRKRREITAEARQQMREQIKVWFPSAVTPSPGTPGEGRGEGDFERKAVSVARNQPHPNPLPDYREREPIRISVVLPVYNVPENYLRKCLDSVTRQIYPHWELCIVDDGSTRPHIRKVLVEYSRTDSRIKVAFLPTNQGISKASNAALELVTGDFIALLDHDDELAEHALFKVAEALVQHPDLDMIYTDEDKLSPSGKHIDAFFKPDWSPEYFLSCMYTCHLGVYRTDLIRRLGGWRAEYDGSQDYDLVLRVISATDKILHIPDVLYHWRVIPTSTASGAGPKPLAYGRARKAIEDHLVRLGREGRVEEGPTFGFHRVRYSIRDSPLVSIIIPTASKRVQLRRRESWFVLECVRSIRKRTTYQNLEIIVIDNGDMPAELANELQPHNVKLISFTEPFNLARKMNAGAFAAAGSQLVILNDDIEVISPDWIESMLEFSQWPEIGAVGAQLLFPDGTQQHNGVTVLEGRPGHPFYQFPGEHEGYYLSSKVHRNWSAVTGACMMTRGEVFESVGGFSEKFPVNYNDVDYCLKVQQTGRRIVQMPYARLYHHESVSVKRTGDHELTAFQDSWLQKWPRDPYYNPNLTMNACDFAIA